MGTSSHAQHGAGDRGGATALPPRKAAMALRVSDLVSGGMLHIVNADFSSLRVIGLTPCPHATCSFSVEEGGL